MSSPFHLDDSKSSLTESNGNESDSISTISLFSPPPISSDVNESDSVSMISLISPTPTSSDVNESFYKEDVPELAIDRAIAGLKETLGYYEKKALSCEQELGKLGFGMQDLPDYVKQDLKMLFTDEDGAFVFQPGRSEALRISGDHVIDSLREKYELGRLEAMNIRMDTVVDGCRKMHENLHRQLEAEKKYSEQLKGYCRNMEASTWIIDRKIQEATSELRAMQQSSQGIELPKYSLEELENMRQEIKQLDTEISVITNKLSRYNNLPLNEEGVKKEVENLKEEIKMIDVKIRENITL